MIQPTLHQFIANCNDLDRIKRYSKLLSTKVTKHTYQQVYTDYTPNMDLAIEWMERTLRTFEEYVNHDKPFNRHYERLISQESTIKGDIEVSIQKFGNNTENLTEAINSKIKQAKVTLKNLKKLPI